MTFSTPVFARQLRYWSLHCLLNALPSLGIALLWMQLWRNSAAVLAMFSAIGTFIILYTMVTTLTEPLHRSDHILSRSIKLGAKIRAWISGASLLLLPTGGLIMFTPDYWCGLLSIGLVNRAAWILSGETHQFFAFDSPNNTEFLPVYAVTMIEGLLLSFLLLMISFFALLTLQARQRRKMLLR